MPLPYASHNICIDPLQLPSIVASTMLAFQADEMVANIAHLTTILTVDIARRSRIRRGHGLHPHGRIQQRKVLLHVLRALLAQRAGVAVPPHVLREAAEVHDMPAPEAAEGFRALEHGFMTDGTISLQPLGDTVVFVFQGDASVAPHAMAVVNSQALSRSADIAKRAMVNRLVGRVVVEVANLARVPRERLPRRLAVGVDACVARGLQRAALHAKYLRHLVPVQHRVFVLGGHLAGLFAAEAAGVESSRRRVAEFAGSSIMGASEHLIDAAIVIRWSKLRRGE